MDKTIKTKSTKKDIRILDKTAVVGKNIRHNYVRMKNNTEHNQKNEHSPVDYAESNIENAVKTTLYKTCLLYTSIMNGLYYKNKNNRLKRRLLSGVFYLSCGGIYAVSYTHLYC